MIGNALAVRPQKEKEEKVEEQLARSDSKSQESNYKKELEEAYKVCIPNKLQIDAVVETLKNKLKN
jgi:hypothetical protein